ncbi:MAG: NFACT family protein [Candidatus Bathyarchaeota archaeon]|nr:MAG: NFACT family protein [Candidatus Bathyarchaeota archaeon]
MQRALTSFEVSAIISELKPQFEHTRTRIQNIYQLKGNALILKLHQPSHPTTSLLIDPGKRMHLTSYLLEKPKRPPSFCMALRKYLRNGTITEISQHEFERIVIIKVRTKNGEFKLIAELFADGNIILVDDQDLIQQALIFKRMRDRNILIGEHFQHAPPSGKNPLDIRLAELLELNEFKELETVRALTKLLSISGQYAEELLLRAEVDKNKKSESLEKGELAKIFSALNEVYSTIETRQFEPCIVIDETGEWIDVVPIPLKKYSRSKCQKFASFNEALDEYWAKTFVEGEIVGLSEIFKQRLQRQQRILEEQQASSRKLEQEAKWLRSIGDKIYLHFHELQMLSQGIRDMKSEGEAWQEIVSKVLEEKELEKVPSLYFESLDTKNLVLVVSIDGTTFSLKLRRSVQENAATYYNKAKKAEKKAEGAKKAMRETLGRISQLKMQKQIEVEEADQPITKRKKKAWFEKFRWFHSSEDMLVVGGKDAITNEILVKKHMETHDLIFHADIIGAPFVLIKTEGRAPTHQSITEAAQLAASHSKAWKVKFSAIDVFWVRPAQVIKVPPSGKQLPKGTFMIKGKKNYIRKTPLRLAIGLDIERTPPVMIGGPTDAVKSRTEIYVEIIPGDFTSNKLANRIHQILSQKIPENLRKEFQKRKIQAIQAFIPYGKAKIIKQ